MSEQPAPPIQRYLTTAGAMAVLLVMAAITWYSNSAANAALEQVVLRNVKPLLALQSIDRQVKEVRFRVASVVLDQMPAPGSRQHLGEAGTAIPAAWREYRAATATAAAGEGADADEVPLVARVEQGLAVLAQIFAELDRAYAADDDKRALLAILEDDWPRVTTELVKPMTRLIALREADMADAYRANRTLGRQLDIAAVVMSLLVGLLAWRILREPEALRRQVALRTQDLVNANAELAAEVAERRLVEAALLESEGRLERRVADRTAELTAANAALQEQHRQQQALLQTIATLQRSHQSILDSLGEGVYGVDVAGCITFANPALERMLGWRSAELIGRPSHATLHHSRADGSPYPPEACPLHQAFRSGQMRSAADEVFWRKDGAAIAVEYTTNPILETGQIVGAVVVFKDITQRRQAEQELVRSYDALKCANRELEQTHVQLLHAEKMASIGQLAAGIAHEINNPIGFVNSNLGSLERYVAQLLELVAAFDQAEPLLPADAPAARAVAAARERADLEFLREDVAALLRDSRDGVGRVKRIVDDLKDFSQVDRLDWQEADLHRGLDSTLNVVWHEIKSKADVVKQYGRLPPVECMVSQLNQVFMNLLVNAAQAIDGHGTITLRSGVDAPPAQTVWIEIADSGHGIAPDILARIFEPFFTTRPVGQGSGLGLAISYGIVKKHGGTIAVTSTPGQGSSFRITLPQQRAATA